MYAQYLHIKILKGTGTELEMCVPFWEFAVLSATHNTDSDEGVIENVILMENKGDEGYEIRKIADDFDIDDEYARILAVYGKKEAARNVRGLWKDEDAFENALEKNDAGCRRDIKKGAKVWDEPAIMLVNPSPKKRQRNRKRINGVNDRVHREEMEPEETEPAPRRGRPPKVEQLNA